jgi:hypothetical protein
MLELEKAKVSGKFGQASYITEVVSTNLMVKCHSDTLKCTLAC